ncbi:MAG TPA: MFS transporter [Solimonas sp.]|nr:MFS transporter [Solimonas sp.]
MNQTAASQKMPAGIPYIVANEFAERFCYYGINAILAIYMVQHLRFPEAQATTWQSLFKSAVYFFPLVGAIVSDVFLGKFRTIILFSLAYCAGCAILALVPGEAGLIPGLALIALGTGGIKPCVSTNVGDQFTEQNQHLIERAFSWFYLSINAGSLISILACPVLLETSGPKWAFGVPGIAMFLATIAFWMGRKKFAVVPPAGMAWLREVLSAEGLKTIGRLSVIYFFVAFFWALWEQSNGQTWTLQAQSVLMDKRVFAFLAGLPGMAWAADFEMLPSQIQFVNALFILMLVPVFSYGIYPAMNRFFGVTPLRKMGIGFFVAASSFLVVSWIEAQIQAGQAVSLWWQILAYAILTAAEVLVSITALEYSYKQAPLRMKSFIMALFLLSTSVGNLITAGVNNSMVRPLEAVAGESGAQTWVQLADVSGFVTGQKIDFTGETGLTVQLANGQSQPLAGTYLVAAIDAAAGRVQLMDVIQRQPLQTTGQFNAAQAEVATYQLVGPQYFNFFAMLMAAVGLVFMCVAVFIPEKTHVREATPEAA